MSNRASLVVDFQENFRAPYIADDRRELSGLPRSDVNMAVNDYRWMLAHFHQLIDSADKVNREDEVRRSCQGTPEFLLRVVTERQPMAENTWVVLINAFKDTYAIWSCSTSLY